MHVKEIMNKDVIKVLPSTPLVKLIDQFKGFHRFPMVPVVNEDNKLIGKVSFENLLEIFHPYTAETRRLLRAIPFMEQEDPMNIFKVEIPPEMGVLLVVEDFMDIKVISVKEDEIIEKAYKLMKLNNRDHLPVVNTENELVGVLGVFDIILALFKQKGILK